MKNFSRGLAYRLRKVVRKENDFIFGMAEIISNNFDYVFRYIYACAFLLLMASHFLDQTIRSSGYSFMAASIVATLIFLISLSIMVI